VARRADGSPRITVGAWTGPEDWHHSQALAPARKGYHYSHVVTPDIRDRVAPGSLEALRVWEAYRNPKTDVPNRMVPIVWVGSDRVRWLTAQEADRRTRIVRLVTTRTRGLRTTQRALAARLGVSLGQVSRTIRNLERAGVLEVQTVRGRKGLTKLRRGLALLVPTSRNLSVLGRNITALAKAWRPWDQLLDGETYVPKPYDPPPPRAPEPDPEPAPAGPTPAWLLELRARMDAYRAEVNREVCW
jgi:hypothetical protein